MLVVAGQNLVIVSGFASADRRSGVDGGPLLPQGLAGCGLWPSGQNAVSHWPPAS
jgi:hypothetical protein